MALEQSRGYFLHVLSYTWVLFLIGVGLRAFLFYWNDFINPLLYLRSQTLYTLPVGLLQLQEMDKTSWSLLTAASVIVTVPALIVFAALQRSLLTWDSE